MKISIVTLFPELYTPFLQTSLLRRADEKGVVKFDVASMLDVCAPKERVDAPTFGHGPGMLIRPEVVERAVEAQEHKHGAAFKIFFSPHGKKITQPMLQALYARIQEKGGHCMTIAARYEGIDARAEEYYADEVLSIGDFVLMGGDLPAMMFLEGLLRFCPGVVGREESVHEDSFTGPFVDHPHYAAPVEWKGIKVPDVIRSGDHAALASWRQNMAVERTVLHHFDWVRSHATTMGERALVRKALPHHYVALMHTGIVMADNESEGTTSVTSIDIHDLARSTKTYGIEHYFVVTPLDDQKKIVGRLLEFWQEGAGVTYREHRHEALRSVSCVDSLAQVVEDIERREGKKPIIVATSAKEVAQEKNITYYDQERVWAEKRPILIIFGTGNGLGPSILNQCDYVLMPLEGFCAFNHLSVRSAAAIVLDRWLGINIKNSNYNKDFVKDLS